MRAGLAPPTKSVQAPIAGDRKVLDSGFGRRGMSSPKPPLGIWTEH